MGTKIGRDHLYKKYAAYPKWQVDHAIDWADAHRNRDYVGMLLEFGTSLHETIYYRVSQDATTKEAGK